MPYAESALLPLLGEFVGRELTLADLNRAAAVVTRHFHEHGHAFRRAYVPAQDLKDGIVEIAVLDAAP